MGVTGTRCAACGLPLHFDHYVPDASGSGLKIYRGSQPDGGHTWAPGENPVRFGAEHEWLRDAVAVMYGDGGVVEGPVEDGVLDDPKLKRKVFIVDEDEGVGYHRRCWVLAGQPTLADGALRGSGTHGWSLLSVYDGQLFELREYIDDGHAWALADPNGSAESRARIESVIAQAKRAPDKGATVKDVLEADRGWDGVTLRHPQTGKRTDQIHYRRDLTAAVDRSGYEHLVWLMKEYDGDSDRMPSAAVRASLEAFELRLKQAIEANAAAVLLMCTVGRGQCQYLIYAKDEKATCATIDALPGRDDPKPASYDNERDPEWKVYFGQMDPRRYLG
jgi:hypothetical protein